MREIIKRIKEQIPQSFHKPLKAIIWEILKIYFLINSSVNKYILRYPLITSRKQLHLGCGDIKMKNFINMDYRATIAADIIHDCTDLSIYPDKCFRTVYAHAFFEHIYRTKQIKLLKDIKRVLNQNGKLVLLGIPDFERIAQAYLNKEKGITGKIFDLFNVYRYTHGDPEQYPDWWLEQLHKGLFDKKEVETLLRLTGFMDFHIFRYSFQNEEIPLNLGLVALKNENHNVLKLDEIKKLLKTLNPSVNLSSVVTLAKTPLITG